MIHTHTINKGINNIYEKEQGTMKQKSNDKNRCI